jgi:hypothetical protein
MATRSFFATGTALIATTSGGVDNFGPIHGKGGVAYPDVGGPSYRAAVPFTLSKLRIRSGSTITGTGRGVRTFVNEVQQSLTVTSPDGVLAIGDTAIDTTNSVSVAAGDKLAASTYRATGTNNVAISAVVTAPGSNAIVPLLATGTLIWTTLPTRRAPLSGNLSIVNSASAESVGLPVASPGIVRGLFAYVSANASVDSGPGTGVGTITLEDNAVSTGILLTTGVGETGYFFENTTTYSVLSGDFVDVRVSGTTGNSVSISALGATIVSDDRSFDIFDYHSRTFNVANNTIYIGLTGGDPGSTAPLSLLAMREVTMEFPARLDKFQIRVVNSYDVAMVVDVLVDGATCGLTIPVPAGTTLSNLPDDIDTYDLAVGQRVALRAQPSGAAPTTGTFNVTSHRLRFTDLTPNGPGSTGNFLLMFA